MKFKSNKKVVTAVTTFHRLRCIQFYFVAPLLNKLCSMKASFSTM